MQEDALKVRPFSNIVAEYMTEFDAEHPLKVVGGQHRFKAIQAAYAKDVNEYHGVKVYFGLTTEQRLDAQLISNTNIEISGDLCDSAVISRRSSGFETGRADHVYKSQK